MDLSSSMNSRFSAWGKLMLFGEYLVLRGAKSMAFPLNVGQHLEVIPHADGETLWQSFEGDTCWLEIRFSKELEIISTNDEKKANVIQELLKLIQSNNPAVEIIGKNFKVTTDFNRAYGFGTSSTLIALLSQWSGQDSYDLLAHSFGGSGYDVATALSRQAIVYTVENRMEKQFDLSAKVTDHLLFVYLGQKQDSAKEVASFKNKEVSPEDLVRINEIIDAAVSCSAIEEWEDLMNESEVMLANILEVSTVQNRLFSDYPYAVKSLGAWGGDFVMASYRNEAEARKYFQEKGLTDMFNYQELTQ